MVTEITTSTFDTEVLQSDKPVLVDFWAAWCGPCRMLAPIVDEIAGEYSDKFKFCKVNIDENEELAYKFGIQSIPTLISFKDGEVANRITGLRPKEEILSALQSV